MATNSIVDAFTVLRQERERLHEKFGGYPRGATALFVFPYEGFWVPIVQFAPGATHLDDRIFDYRAPLQGADPIGSPAPIGTCVEGDGGLTKGSVGWNVEFNGKAVFVTSRHIGFRNIQPPPPPPPNGAVVQANPYAGSADVVWSPAITGNGLDVFDIALLEYVNGTGQAAVSCGGNYPMKFATKLNPATDTFKSSGAKTCGRDGSLVAVTDVLVDYTNHGGSKIWLKDQLILKLNVQKGDSGSIVVRQSDNEIVGLNCAETVPYDYAVANPFFKIGWTVNAPGQMGLPVVTHGGIVYHDLAAAQPTIAWHPDGPVPRGSEEFEAVARNAWVRHLLDVVVPLGGSEAPHRTECVEAVSTGSPTKESPRSQPAATEVSPGLRAFTEAPAAQSSRLIDFKTAEIKYCGFTGAPTLVVSGEVPCLNMKVSLRPRVYLACPEYWEIEVVGDLPGGICIDAMKPYCEILPLTGTIGSRGIEVVGAKSTRKFELGGGCKSGSTAPTE